VVILYKTPRVINELGTYVSMVMNRNIAVMMMSIALFTGQVCLAPGASGQDISAPNQFELEYVGSAMWGEYHDIARNGDYVYCAMTNGLQILDISDPTNPVLAKRVFLNRVALSVALLDDRLYLGCRDGYLYQYSVSDPANPVLLGEMNLDFCGRINDIVPRNDTVFLACQMGMYVVDIGDLSDPEVVGTYVELGYHPEARALELIGDTLHLCAGAFAMVDVSNPAQPTKIASYDVWGEAYDVIVEDDLIYLVDHDVSEPSGYSRFLILSSAEPDTLEVVGSYIFWGHLKDIAEIDSYIFCATEYSGVVVLDVSAPPNLSLAGCLFPHLGEVVDIEVSDNLAFVANRAPQPHTYTAFHNVCDGDSIAITVPPNEHANSGDFVALDVSDRASPKMIGRYPFSGWADHVTTCGDYAFVISEMGDMAIVDISSPGSMRAVSRIDVPERIRSEPAVQGSYVYVAGRYDGLLVVDVSNVYEPEVVGEIDWGGWAYSVVVQGDYAYVTDFGFGLVVINVSDPAALDLVGSLPIDGSSYDIAIYADYVFVSGLGAGLHLVDVSDPEHPQYVSHRSITARELALVGDRLCSVSDSVEILDISGAPNLELLGAYHVSWPWIYGLSVSENYAILALADLGIQVVDITDPGAPQLVSTFDTPSFSTGVDVGGDMVCIADIYSLISLRLPDPTDVEEPPGHDSFLPTGYELYQNRPNPFNPSTQIAYDIPSGTDVRLSIHNILGQQVRILVDSYETAGHHTVVWDGCDSRGNPVASGVYFYRLAAGGESRSLKMLLLK
jgi:hypothetical protein